jgi:hypothetical protein
VEHVSFSGDLGGIPVRPRSADDVRSRLETLRSEGRIGSFDLTGRKLVVRGWNEGDFSQLEIIYSPRIDEAEAILGTLQNALASAQFVDATLLANKPARFIGAMESGYLYTGHRPNEALLLSVPPEDPTPPRLLKVVWSNRPMTELAGALRLVLATKKEAPPPELDASAPLLTALSRGPLLDRLEAFERWELRELPPKAEAQLRDLAADLHDASVAATQERREATAAYYRRAKAKVEETPSYEADAWKTGLMETCWSPVRVDGTLGEKDSAGIAAILTTRIGASATRAGGNAPFHITGLTPVVELSPKFSRQPRSSSFRGEVRRTERFSGATQQRLAEIAARLSQIEKSIASPDESSTRDTLETEKAKLEEERARLMRESPAKIEEGERTFQYFALGQTWTGAVKLTASVTRGDQSKTIVVRVPYTGRTAYRVTPNPEKNVKALEEWVSESAARADAVAKAKQALYEKLAEEILFQAAQCARASAASVLGTDEERAFESVLRARLFMSGAN